MKTSKYIAIAASIFALLLAGCGEEKSQTKPQTTPQAAPAKQIQAPLPDKVVSKGKIVGTQKMSNGQVVQVEEREVETYGIGDKRIIEKRYYEAGTENRVYGYGYKLDHPDKQIKNEGQSMPKFKSH